MSNTHAIPAHQQKARYSPLATVPASQHQQTVASNQVVQCCTCGKSFLSSALMISDLDDNTANLAGCTCMATLYCDHCNALMMRQFACDSSGRKLTAPIGKTRVILDRKLVEKFLKDHPHAAGVEQA